MTLTVLILNSPLISMAHALHCRPEMDPNLNNMTVDANDILGALSPLPQESEVVRFPSMLLISSR